MKSGFRVRAPTFISLPSDRPETAGSRPLLCDAHYVTDASKYISVLLLSLRTMLHLELPHVNVLSKVDLITQYGDLGTAHDHYISQYKTLTASFLYIDFNPRLLYGSSGLVYYLENALSSSSPRFSALNMAMISLIEDYSLVGFETLAVEANTFFDFPVSLLTGSMPTG